MALFQAEKSAEAIQALQLCLKQAPKHTQARALFNKLTGKTEKHTPVYIVSGFPRSGTSLMMQMLKRGGVDVATDSKRKADQHNPKGYFELNATLKLGQSAGWLKEMEGKAVKVLLPLLRFLPAELNYKIILMERPLQEIILSQELMKGREKNEIQHVFPFDLAVKMQGEEKRIKSYLGQLPGAEVL